MIKALFGGFLFCLGVAGAVVPVVEDGRFEITLFAEQPEIWTPTGVAVDPAGRVFVIESNTHLPKTNYTGPKTDRIKIFEDKNGDGKADTNSIFAEGFNAAMNLLFAPMGELFVVERARVSILRDKNHDRKADTPEIIATLQTQGDFPHNGLGGIALGPDGWLYLGFGENLGLPYTLTGSDGSRVSGGNEGGDIFRCRPDGSKMELFATGFWNPFSLAFDGSGNLFAVDNDPDGRPPCRLLHVIRGGNYGYQFRYGRSGLHPFVAWDGEVPGTLPMVSGTGEAPSGLIWLPALGWPEEYQNSFLGTSWGDNLIETFPLEPRGVSFKADRKRLARGDLSFRPVAIAAGPNGEIYMTDWADREYAVHQKGRIWKLALKPKSIETLLTEATSDDPFTQSAAITALSKRNPEALAANGKLPVLLALRQKGVAPEISLLKSFLQDENEQIRQMAIIWVAELRLKELGPELVAAALKSPTSLTLLQTYLGAEQILAGYEKKSVWERGSTGADLVEALLGDSLKPKELRDLALKLKTLPQTRPTVGAPVAEPPRRPASEREWLAAIGFGGDPDAGEKLFFSEKLACARCHRVQGQGGKIGPDLSVIARSSDRAKLVNSILDPSANIGPLFVTREITTKNGVETSGLVLDTKASDNVTVIQSDGKEVEISKGDIASDYVSNVSLMPTGLENGLSVREFADLISYLQSLK